MAAFRINDPFPAYQNASGAPVAGGSLKFYETGTTTLKNVYGDKALTVNNGSTVALDASGRTNVDVWGSGAYRVRLYDSLNVLIDEADNVELPGGAATSLPAMVAGKFLTSDGSVLSWATISQLPDMTGAAGKILGTDGTLAIWQALAATPSIPATGIALVGATGLRIGTVQLQWGSVTMPITGTHTTSSAITFPTAFSAAPYFVSCSSKTGGISSSGAQGTITCQSQSTTGFTANMDVNIDSVDAGWNVSIAANLQWFAVGPVA